MKTRFKETRKAKEAIKLFAIIATVVLPAAGNFAQSWDTLLPQPDFAPGWSGGPTLLDPHSVDPANPGVFVGCWSDSPEAVGSILRLDYKGSSTFTVSVVDAELARVYGMAHDVVNDVIYAVGDGSLVTAPPFPRVNPTVWKVRKSLSGNASTWTTDEVFALTTKTYASARGIAADGSGNLYVCGEASPSRGSLHWIVRKLPPGGSWSTVADVSGQGDATARGICFFPGNSVNPAEALLTVGVINNRWAVLRSQNHGATWAAVDSWAPTTKSAATASKVVCDSAGTLYVVGWRGSYTAPVGWVVRTSTDGGTTWNTVLDISEGANSCAASVTADGVGSVWVSGYTMNAAGTPRWTVLKNGVSGTLSENNSAFLQARQLPFGDTYSKARGIATDAAGANVFITGELKWVDGTSRVALQRLLP